MRFVVRLMLVLFMGCVVTVLVGWCFALFGEVKAWEFTFPPAPGTRLSSASRVPEGWEPRTYLKEGGFGLEYELVSEGVWMGSELGFTTDSENRSIERTACGWPRPALEWIGAGDHRADANGWDVRAGLTPPVRATRLIRGAERRLALVPLWPGFAADSLLYGAAVGVVWLAAWLLRRALRKRRGGCLVCAYPLGGLAVCPECGWRARVQGAR